MTNQELITLFYSAFAKGDVATMQSCYHDDIEFSDPAFGKLKGQEAKDMWGMLMRRSKGNIQISASDIQANDEKGNAKWTAVYLFASTGNMVTNHISATFEFKDGKIIKHDDVFDLWKWAGQALGWKGKLFGWLPGFQAKIQSTTRSYLTKYMEEKK